MTFTFKTTGDVGLSSEQKIKEQKNFWDWFYSTTHVLVTEVDGNKKLIKINDTKRRNIR